MSATALVASRGKASIGRQPVMSLPDRDFEPNSFGAIPDPLVEVPELPSPGFVPNERPTRDEMKRRRHLALLLGAGWMAGQLVVFGVRDDFAAVPAHHVLALVAGPVIGTGVCLVAAFSGGRRGTGVRVAALVALVLAFPTALLLLGFALSSDAQRGTLEDAAHCFNVMLAWTAVPLAAAAFALRRSFVGRSGLRSALVGLGAGLAAAAAMNLHCSFSDAVHMTLGHGLAVVLAGAAGALGLERALRA